MQCGSVAMAAKGGKQTDELSTWKIVLLAVLAMGAGEKGAPRSRVVAERNCSHSTTHPSTAVVPHRFPRLQLPAHHAGVAHSLKPCTQSQNHSVLCLCWVPPDRQHGRYEGRLSAPHVGMVHRSYLHACVESRRLGVHSCVESARCSMRRTQHAWLCAMCMHADPPKVVPEQSSTASSSSAAVASTQEEEPPAPKETVDALMARVCGSPAIDG